MQEMEQSKLQSQNIHWRHMGDTLMAGPRVKARGR